MALVVETYSSASSTDEIVSITKPVGVSSGDLLLIVASVKGAGSVTCSGFTSAWSNYIDHPGGISDVGVTVLYRIADSSDVAASTYSVTSGAATDGSAVAMLRISGWDAGNPIYQSSYGGFYNSTNGTFSVTGLSLPRLSHQIAIMIMGSYDNADSDYYGTATNRTITSSDSNPTWTQVCDILGVTNNVNGLSAKSLNVAYATTTTSSTVTGFSFNYAEFDADEEAGGIGVLLLLESPISQTVSNALLQTSPVTFATLTGSTQEPTNDFHEASPEFPNQSGKATAPTQWTSATKNTTTWTNTNKS